MRDNTMIMTVSDPGGAADSAGGGAQRDPHPPISSTRQLGLPQHGGRADGGSSAVRATDQPAMSGPRNSFPVDAEKSSSKQQVEASSTVSAGERAQDYMDRQDSVEVQPPVTTPVFAQPQPSQAQPIVPIATSIASDGQNVRPVRARKAPDRLIVGDPNHARFNRNKGR